jgi:hypothetical protein
MLGAHRQSAGAVFLLLALLWGCSRRQPPVAPSPVASLADAGGSPDASASQEDGPGAGEWATLVEELAFEHDEGGIIKHYSRPVARIPMQYLRLRGGDGAWMKSYVIRLLCDRTRRCYMKKMLSFSEEHFSTMEEIPRKSLVWLPSTDLLGLPVEQGGRRPLSEAEEGTSGDGYPMLE